MNFIYKIKKNRRTGCNIVVSELCHSAGKQSGAISCLLALCGGILFSLQAMAGAVNGQYNYQDYMDFGSNLGRFTVGVTDIPFYLKKNSDKITPDYSFNYPVPDFSAIDNKRIATLVSPGYAVSAAHLYFGGAALNRPDITGSKKSFDSLLFGDSFYHQVAINRYDNTEKSIDLIIPRLNKFVVEADPVSLIPDNVLSKNNQQDTVSLINNKDRFPVATRTGAGLPRIYQATIDVHGKVSLWGVDDDDTIARLEGITSDSFAAKQIRYSKLLTDQAYSHITGGIIDLIDTETPAKVQYPSASEYPGWVTPERMPESNKLNYVQGFVITNFPYFTNIPYNWTERGDSGSPLFIWDNDTQRWELIGVASRNGRTLFTSRTDWSVVSKSIIQPTIRADTTDIPLNNREALWQNSGDIVASDTSWKWQGIGSLAPSDNPKHIRLTGGGKITLGQNINMGAGGLIFDNNNNYIIAGQASNISWYGAGLDIGAGSTVQWKVNGVAKVPTGSDAGQDDYLHKVGKGTLEVYTENLGGLKLGDGTVVLKTANAFSKTFITSGRGTLKLDAENALDPKNLRFATAGGILDLNGYNMDFSGQTTATGALLATGIRAQDYGTIITNSNMAGTSTISLNNIQKLSSSEPGYLYPGRFTGNVNISSTLGVPLVFNGGIDTPDGVLQRNGGELRFQGEPIIHARIKLDLNHEKLKNLLDENNKANQNEIFASVQANPGFNLPDNIVENQQEFNEQYWNSRNFILKTINATNSPVTVARNSLLSANMNLINSPLTVGDQKVYIDRNATNNAINRLQSGESVASNHEDQARYQGNIIATTKSFITIQNSQIIANITADETSPVILGSNDNRQYSEWRLTNDSHLHSLTMLQNAGLYFHTAKNGSNNILDWSKPNTLTVVNLQSINNNFYFGINPQTMESDKLIVTGSATGVGNTINLNMFFNDASQLITTDKQADLLLARIADSNQKFFAVTPINIGFSQYSPNIRTSIDGSNIEWRLAITTDTTIKLDTPIAVSSEKEPVVNVSPSFSAAALEKFDDIFNTEDTDPIFLKEAEEAEKKRQEEEERKTLPYPVGKAGIFLIQDSSAQRGDSFLPLSEDAKIYIFWAEAKDKFVYGLYDGGTQLNEVTHVVNKVLYPIESLQPDSDGNLKLIYNSQKITGLPLYAREGGRNPALELDIATATSYFTREDFIQIINGLPEDKYSAAEKEKYAETIPAWLQSNATSSVDTDKNTTEKEMASNDSSPVIPIDTTVSTSSTDETVSSVTVTPAAETTNSSTGSELDVSKEPTETVAEVSHTESVVASSMSDSADLTGKEEAAAGSATSSGTETATEGAALVTAEESASTETSATDTAVSPSVADDTATATTEATPDGVIIVPAVSFFTRSDNAPLIRKVENIMRMPQLSFVMETNQLNKRLGDVRHLQQDTGVWLKPGGGIGRYDEMTLRYNSIQGGIDHRRDNHLYGLMISHTRNNAKGSDLFVSGTTTGFGLYYSWVPDEGFFIDVIGKYLKNRQNLHFPGNVIASQSPANNMLIGSVQAGYRLQSEQRQNFIEPSVEIVAGHISGYSMYDSNAKIDLQTGNPIYAKIGLNAGKQWQLNEQQNVSVALGAFRLQNLKRGGSLNISDRFAGQQWQLRSTRLAATDNRYLLTLSVNVRVSDNWRLYTQAETSFADSKHYNLNGHIGVRYQF